MKLRTFCCIAVLFCIAHTLAFAQSITLDSLWGKYVGTVYAMCFTPDSKYLLVAFDNYRTTIFDAQSGEEIRTFKTHYGCFEMKFSPDGGKLYSFSSGGVDILDATTFTSLDTVSFSFPSEEGATQYDVSNDGKYFVVKNGYEGINTDYYRMRVISYPEKKVLWLKDVVRWNSNFGYANSKVTFSNDGSYILGLSMNSLCKWNWKDSTSVVNYLIRNLPNQELISFSKDRNYCILLGNFIYDLRTGEQVLLNEVKSDITDYSYGSFLTLNNKLLLTTVKYNLFIVDFTSKRILANTKLEYVYGNYALNADNSLLVTPFGVDYIRIHRVVNTINKVDEERFDELKLDAILNQNSENVTLNIISKNNTNANIYITDLNGKEIFNLKEIKLYLGLNQVTLNRQDLVTGTYYINVSLNNKVYTTSFIITK
ncbi:MAG: T9SS type A sorting domain-containing protein [Bacteriodetes bacterium]|nr:T9SS type A sorting domain-containing protein [Bacteroidota bacterium]